MSLTVGIIGAGFTGLAAAYHLAKSGCKVTVFEADDQPGGLAVGFTEATWDWPPEKHYHHLFTSDWAIRNLANEVGHSIDFYRPQTSTYIDDQIYQLDSPTSLLKFTPLPLVDRLRAGAVLAGLRLNPFWQPLENFTAADFLRVTMGRRSWQLLWEPLFQGKFHQHANEVSAAWFWGRIAKRSASLGYPRGGFLSLARAIEKSAVELGAKFFYHRPISQAGDLLTRFDRVICTLPTPAFSKISGLQYPKLSGLGVVNLLLSLKHQFLTDGTYWLNINDRSFPFVCVCEQTNFIDSGHYGGEHLVYVGNYLPPDHPYFNYSNQRLLTEFLPHLQKINPSFRRAWIRRSWVFTAPFAQPIIATHYSQKIPSFSTSIPNLYLANIQQVYPWDRGTNYAVELGRKVADLCLK